MTRRDVVDTARPLDVQSSVMMMLVFVNAPSSRVASPSFRDVAAVTSSSPYRPRPPWTRLDCGWLRFAVPRTDSSVTPSPARAAFTYLLPTAAACRCNCIPIYRAVCGHVIFGRARSGIAQPPGNRQRRERSHDDEAGK